MFSRTPAEGFEEEGLSTLRRRLSEAGSRIEERNEFEFAARRFLRKRSFVWLRLWLRSSSWVAPTPP